MLQNYLRPIQRLNLLVSQSIVIRYNKRRAIFDKTTYNPDWIAPVTPYSRYRKPRMKIWSDPDEIVPYQIPPLHRFSKNPKTYLKNVI